MLSPQAQEQQAQSHPGGPVIKLSLVSINSITEPTGIRRTQSLFSVLRSAIHFLCLLAKNAEYERSQRTLLLWADTSLKILTFSNVATCVSC